MKLTTKTRYGMRAAVDLARRYKEGPISVSSISERENISISYLEQLLNKLKKNGIVNSLRGPHGGYMLARPPADIKVYDIVRTLEGDLNLVFCLADKRTKNCNKIDECATKPLWQKLNASIESVLKSATLANLCGKPPDRKKEKKLNHRFTYSI